MKVLMLDRVACDYRQVFYEALHRTLCREGHEFTLMARHALPDEGLVDIMPMIPFGRVPPTICLGRKFYWQTEAFRAACQADFVVLDQSLTAMHYYPLFVVHQHRRRTGRRVPRIAFWGHGTNLNIRVRQPVREAVRAWLTLHADWWFAYTDHSRAVVSGYGYPQARITVVNNAHDTKSLRRAAEALTADDRAGLAGEIFGPSAETGSVGCFCGRLTTSKWIPFLLESVLLIRERVPCFRMFFIGDGEESRKVQSFCRDHAWCRWLGATHGPERARYLSLADIWLNPGMTGIGILDAFAVGIPFATTDNGIHSPEIAYLQTGVNGVMTAPTVQAFSHEVATVLCDRPRLLAMKQAAGASGERFSAEQMAERFAQGLRQWMSDKGTPSGRM